VATSDVPKERVTATAKPTDVMNFSSQNGARPNQKRGNSRCFEAGSHCCKRARLSVLALQEEANKLAAQSMLRVHSSVGAIIPSSTLRVLARMTKREEILEQRGNS